MGIYKNATAPIVLNGKRLTAAQPSRTSPEVPSPPPASWSWKLQPGQPCRKKKYRHQTAKEAVTLCLHEDGGSCAWKIPKNPSQNTGTNTQVQLSCRIKGHCRKRSELLHTSNELPHNETKKISPFTTASQTLKHLGINLTKCKAYYLRVTKRC